jgi:hypothetical protein
MFPFLICKDNVKKINLTGSNQFFCFQSFDEKQKIQAILSVIDNDQAFVQLTLNNKTHQFKLNHCLVLKRNEDFFVKSKELLENFFLK